MQRIIGELRPKYAIMENVPALTFRGLDRVLGSLADIGYDAVWTVVSARDIGAPHLRKRIWIIAYPTEQQSSMCDPESSEQGQIKSGRMGGKDEFSNTDEIGCRNRECNRQERSILPERKWNSKKGEPERNRWESRPIEIREAIEFPDTSQVRRRGGHTQERGGRETQTIRPQNGQLSQMVQANNGHLQWQRTFEPEFVRVVDGIPNQLDRIGACGNSIVPGIAKILFELCQQTL